MTDPDTLYDDPVADVVEADDPAPPTAGKPAREPVLGLSMTQVVGGSAAAATAAALGSRLGVVGTVVGAALISVVTAVAGAVYSRSLQRTKEVVARAGERLPTVRIPAQRGAEAPSPTAEPGVTPPWWQRVRWRPVVVTAVVVFLLAGGIVTGIEQLTGRSLDGTGRTSVDHLVGRDSTPTRTDNGSGNTDRSGSDGNGSKGSDDTGQGSGTPATDQPSSTPTAEPSDGPTDGSATPTPTPTPTPTSQPSATPSAQPTG